MRRYTKHERLTLAEAPDVCSVDEFARILGVGTNYARHLVRADYVANFGSQYHCRIPRLAILLLLDKVARREIVLPSYSEVRESEKDRSDAAQDER